MIKRVYIDTSVFGGYFDSEFAEPTKKFFKVLNTKNITILVSEILELEVYKAPDHIVELFESLTNIERLQMTDEAKILAELYISENVVGRTSIADCQHIALATINRTDVLVSWNFKHIVNLERNNRFKVVWSYKIIYEVTDKAIYILDIFHTSRDPSNIKRRK
jgi:predicted nucleic acid-binding protein